MRVYSITVIGDSLASNPTNNMTDGMKILYFLKRHGGQASDEQIEQYVLGDRSRTQLALNRLRQSKAIEAVA